MDEGGGGVGRIKKRSDNVEQFYQRCQRGRRSDDDDDDNALKWGEMMMNQMIMMMKNRRKGGVFFIDSTHSHLIQEKR